MVSTRGRYALRVMIDLAENAENGFVPLKDVAARQDISKKYLEIIMRDMVSGGLVEAASGKRGGYKLSRKPSEYTVLEIIEASEGGLAPVACLADNAEPCPRASNCRTLPMWEEYKELIYGFFSGKKLSDFLHHCS